MLTNKIKSLLMILILLLVGSCGSENSTENQLDEKEKGENGIESVKLKAVGGMAVEEEDSIESGIIFTGSTDAL